jgi:hypothetical protein
MSRFIILPEQSVLQTYLDLDTQSGLMTWKNRGVLDGRPALRHKNQEGYFCGRIFTIPVLAHRVVWKIVHGFDPEEIDHIDGNRINNNISNLRSVPRSENMKNKRVRRDNRTGFSGISVRENGKYRATIRSGGRRYDLGTHSILDDAIQARTDAESRFNFHHNHGKR